MTFLLFRHEDCPIEITINEMPLVKVMEKRKC